MTGDSERVAARGRRRAAPGLRLRRGERVALALLVSIVVAIGLLLSVLAVFITVAGGLAAGGSVRDRLDGRGSSARRVPAGDPGPSWPVVPPGGPVGP